MGRKHANQLARIVEQSVDFMETHHNKTHRTLNCFDSETTTMHPIGHLMLDFGNLYYHYQYLFVKNRHTVNQIRKSRDCVYMKIKSKLKKLFESWNI